jgi:threonine/homoserine efflux transporter RhtA
MSVSSISPRRFGRPKPVGVPRLQWGALTAGPVAGGGILLASCLSIQVGAALATTTFARVGAAGAAGWRFALAGARRPRHLMCALVAFIGVIALCATKLSANPAGIAFALAAALGWAMYILSSQRAGRHDRPLDSLSVALCVAALITSPLTVSRAVAATGGATLAALVGLIVLGQSLTVLQIAGMALVVVAGATVLRKSA